MGKPKPIANVLAELMARRGYARVQSGARCEDAWRTAAGETLSRGTRAGQIKRGVLEVACKHSTLMQEMMFHKQSLLAKLAELLPEEKIRDLKFRLGPID